MARKTEIYTWRVSPALKAALEQAARMEGRSVAQLLDEIVAERLMAMRTDRQDEEQQRRLHEQASRFSGCLSGPDPRRAERARALVRERLSRRRDRAV